MKTILHFIKASQRMHVHSFVFNRPEWWRCRRKKCSISRKEKSIFQVANKSVGFLSIAFMNATNSIYSIMLCYAHKHCSRWSMIFKVVQFTLCQKRNLLSKYMYIIIVLLLTSTWTKAETRMKKKIAGKKRL